MITEIATPEPWETPLRQYLQREALSHEETTTKLRSYHLRRFAQSVNCPPDEVTVDQILQHIENPDWKDAYRRSVLGTLRSFFKWARKSGLITIDPAEDTPSIHAPVPLPRPASPQAVHNGYTALDPRVRLMTRLGNEAGLDVARW